MDDNSPVTYATCANLLLAADQLLKEHHVALATELLVRCEALIPRVADPQGFVSLMNQADRLWKHKYIRTELKPRGMVAQLDLPFGKGEN